LKLDKRIILWYNKNILFFFNNKYNIKKGEENNDLLYEWYTWKIWFTC
jgi:hypothetical protein